jgi:hypothetical protein
LFYESDRTVIFAWTRDMFRRWGHSWLYFARRLRVTNLAQPEFGPGKLLNNVHRRFSQSQPRGAVTGPYTSPQPFFNSYSPSGSFSLGGCTDSLDSGNVTFTNDAPPPTVEGTATVQWAYNDGTTTFDYTATSTSSSRCEPHTGDYYFDKGAYRITGEVTGNSGRSTVSGPIKALECLEQDTVGTPQEVSYHLARGIKFDM